MPGQPLAVREDPQRGVCVSGLTLHKVFFISNKHWVMNDNNVYHGMCMIVSFIICLMIVTLVINCEVSNVHCCSLLGPSSSKGG